MVQKEASISILKGMQEGRCFDPIIKCNLTPQESLPKQLKSDFFVNGTEISAMEKKYLVQQQMCIILK